MLHSHILGQSFLSSCLSLFLWKSKCQKISSWNKSDSESSIPTSPGELSHRSVSWNGPVQSTEGSVIMKECGFESLYPREGERGRERRKSRVKGHEELLVDNAICLWHWSYKVTHGNGALNSGLCVTYHVSGWKLNYSSGLQATRNFSCNANTLVIQNHSLPKFYSYSWIHLESVIYLNGKEGVTLPLSTPMRQVCFHKVLEVRVLTLTSGETWGTQEIISLYLEQP